MAGGAGYGARGAGLYDEDEFDEAESFGTDNFDDPEEEDVTDESEILREHYRH